MTTTNVQTAAGSVLNIGAVPVGEIVDFGEYGKKYNLVTHNPVGNRMTFKFKGSYDNGALTLQLGQDLTDAGQIALLAALDSDTASEFSIDGGPSGSGFTDTFNAQVMSYTTKLGSVDSIIGATCELQITGDIVRT